MTSDLDRIADYVTYIHAGRIRFSCPKDDIRDKWAVVKGPRRLLDRRAEELFAAVREGEFGFEALTLDAHEARGCLPGDVVFEKPTVEEVMVLLAGRTEAAPARADSDGVRR